MQYIIIVVQIVAILLTYMYMYVYLNYTLILGMNMRYQSPYSLLSVSETTHYVRAIATQHIGIFIVCGTIIMSQSADDCHFRGFSLVGLTLYSQHQLTHCGWKCTLYYFTYSLALLYTVYGSVYACMSHP